MKKIPCNESFFSENNENSFYWAGFLAADGNIYKGSLSLSQNDRTIISNFIYDIGSEKRTISEKPYFNRKEGVVKVQHSVSIRSKKLIEDLGRFSIVENKRHSLVFPEWMLDNELARHYVRGYFDGDGAVFKTKGGPRLEFTGTFKFLTGIREILSRDIKFRSNVRKISKNKPTSRLVFTGSKIALKVGKWMWDDSHIFMERKFKKFLTITQNQGIL